MTDIVELWRPVVGYEGLYEISDQGRLLNLQTGKILSAKPSKHLGYVIYQLSQNKKSKAFYAHSLVLESFVSARPSSKHQACHNNGDRADNRVSNLRWGTRSENYEDARRHGTNSKGSRHGQAKLTEEQVIAIYLDCRKRKDIANAYKISPTVITHIKQGTTWGWLTGAEKRKGN